MVVVVRAVALNSAKHMLKIKSGGYALITVGDERPNNQSKWSYQPISCVMLVALRAMSKIEINNI